MLEEGSKCSAIRCHHIGIGGHLYACVLVHMSLNSRPTVILFTLGIEPKTSKLNMHDVHKYTSKCIYVKEQPHYRLTALALLHF